MASSTDDMLGALDELVKGEEHDAVSYKFLSRHLDVSSNLAKQ